VTKTVTLYHGTSLSGAISIRANGFHRTRVYGGRGRPAYSPAFVSHKGIAKLYARDPSISALSNRPDKQRKVYQRALIKATIPKSEMKKYFASRKWTVKGGSWDYDKGIRNKTRRKKNRSWHNVTYSNYAPKATIPTKYLRIRPSIGHKSKGWY
jgi:hypothetical protein